jgi:hypothetical protein
VVLTGIVQTGTGNFQSQPSETPKRQRKRNGAAWRASASELQRPTSRAKKDRAKSFSAVCVGASAGWAWLVSQPRAPPLRFQLHCGSGRTGLPSSSSSALPPFNGTLATPAAQRVHSLPTWDNLHEVAQRLSRTAHCARPARASQRGRSEESTHRAALCCLAAALHLHSTHWLERGNSERSVDAA